MDSSYRYPSSSSGSKRQYGGNSSGESHDQKRPRQSEDAGSSSSNKPSRAIAVRGLPKDCLESELLALVGPFATVEKCVLIPSKNEALVHLPDLDSATNLVTFYQSRDALVRGQKVVFAFAPPSRDSFDSSSHTSSTGPPQSSSSRSYNNAPPSSSSRALPQQSYDRTRPSDHRTDRPPPSSSSGFDRGSNTSGPPPFSSSYDSRRGGPSSPSPYDRSRHAPPPSTSGYVRPQHGGGGPPSHRYPPVDNQHAPPSYDSRGPPPQSSSSYAAPPSYSSSGPPPSSYDQRRSFERPSVSGSSYDPPHRPTTTTYDRPSSSFDRPPPSSYPASAAPDPIAGKNTILIVSISKMDFPVNVDVLHQVFSKYGTVLKIVTFTQRGEFKALVQFQATEQAVAAQVALDGRDIYTGCNTLHIHMSTHKSLNVQCNNDKMRDYFNPNLPSVDPAEQQGEPRGMLGDMPPRRFSSPDASRGRRPAEYPPPPSSSMYPSAPFGGPPPPPYRRDDSRDRGPRRSRDRRSRSRDRDVGADRSTVLICSNLDPHYLKVHSLFTLFGCFGDVLRVKVMFRKPETALVQFVDERHAQSARDHVDGLVLCHKKLRVDFSKHLTVVMPRPDADQFEIQNTRDYTNTPYHRYRKRPLSEVVPVTTLLHIS
ncbi:hypothetical protein DYB38_013314, partial [Aphanomyces astaci]